MGLEINAVNEFEELATTAADAPPPSSCRTNSLPNSRQD
jgi:glyoxylate carboligase